MELQQIRNHLSSLIDSEYQQFQSKLIPNGGKILGVRIPFLRTYARELRDIDYTCLLGMNYESLEEIILVGFLLSQSKKEPNLVLQELELLLPSLQNWEETDVIASAFKLFRKEPELGLAFIEKCFTSEHPYTIRFGFVLLLNYYICESYLSFIFQSVEQIKCDHYYVKMAKAWLLSICYISFPNETNAFFKQTSLDDWTYHKAIQKCIESRQISNEEKERLKAQKR